MPRAGEPGSTEIRSAYVPDRQRDCSGAGQTFLPDRCRLAKTSPGRVLATARQHVDESRAGLAAALGHLVELQREHLRGSALSLHSLSPLLTIGRGFAVVRRCADGVHITSVSEVTPGQGLTIQVSDGDLLPRPPDLGWRWLSPTCSVRAVAAGSRRQTSRTARPVRRENR